MLDLINLLTLDQLQAVVKALEPRPVDDENGAKTDDGGGESERQDLTNRGFAVDVAASDNHSPSSSRARKTKAKENGGLVDQQQQQEDEITLADFLRVLLPQVTESLICSGYQPPLDASTSSASYRTTVSKIAHKELNLIWSDICRGGGGAVAAAAASSARDARKLSAPFSAIVAFLLREIDSRSAKTAQGGISTESVASKHSTVGEAITFEASSSSSSSSAANRLYSCANVSETRQRWNSVCTFVEQWDAILMGISCNGSQGFELVTSDLQRTIRSGLARETHLSAISDVVVLPRNAIIAAVHIDSAVSFWSLPGETMKNSLAHAAQVRKHNSSTNVDTLDGDTHLIVLFKVVPVTASPHHTKVLQWIESSGSSNNSTIASVNSNGSCGGALFSGCADGVLQRWSNEASATVVERLAPIPGPHGTLQVASSNITAVVDCDGGLVCVTSMDRTVTLVDVSKTPMKIIGRRGGKSWNSAGKALGHSQGILCAAYNRSNRLVFTAGFSGDVICCWSIDDPTASPTIIEDLSNVHRAKIVTLFAASAQYLISADAAGIVKVWENVLANNNGAEAQQQQQQQQQQHRGASFATCSYTCIQTVFSCSLGDDEPAPPLLPENKVVNRLAQHHQQHRGVNLTYFVDSPTSARTRRLFAGTSVAASCGGRQFIYAVKAANLTIYSFGPRNTYVLRGNAVTGSEALLTDSHMLLGGALVGAYVVTLHQDSVKIWSVRDSGALAAVMSIRPSLSALAAASCASASTTISVSSDFIVGCQRGKISFHSVTNNTVHGTAASAPVRVFPNEEAVQGIAFSTPHLQRVFVTSNCGSVAVLDYGGGGKVTPLHFLSRNFLLLQRFLEREASLSHNNLGSDVQAAAVIPVRSDGQVHMAERKKSIFMTESSLGGGGGGECAQGAMGPTLKSFRHQQQQQGKSGTGSGGVNCQQQQQQKDHLDDLALLKEEIVSYVPSCPVLSGAQVPGATLAIFAAGTTVLAIDAHTLDLVHCFCLSAAQAARIEAVTVLGALGHIAVLASSASGALKVTVFGLRSSFLANQVILQVDISRAHPTEGEHYYRQRQQQQQQKSASPASFSSALPTSSSPSVPLSGHPFCMAFHPSTSSLLIGSAVDGVLSSWSLRKVRRLLHIRPVLVEGMSRGRAHNNFLAKQLRMHHMSAPEDPAAFGQEHVEFEFRRGHVAGPEHGDEDGKGGGEEEDEEEETADRSTSKKTKMMSDSANGCRKRSGKVVAPTFYIDLDDGSANQDGRDGGTFLEVPALVVDVLKEEGGEDTTALPVCGAALHMDSSSSGGGINNDDRKLSSSKVLGLSSNLRRQQQQQRKQKHWRHAHEDMEQRHRFGILCVLPFERASNRPGILTFGHDKNVLLLDAQLRNLSALAQARTISNSSAPASSSASAWWCPEDERAYLDPYVDLSGAAVAALLATIRDVRVKLAHRKAIAAAAVGRDDDECASFKINRKVACVLGRRLDLVQQHHGTSARSPSSKLDPSLRALLVTPDVITKKNNHHTNNDDDDDNNNNAHKPQQQQHLLHQQQHGLLGRRRGSRVTMLIGGGSNRILTGDDYPFVQTSNSRCGSRNNYNNSSSNNNSRCGSRNSNNNNSIARSNSLRVDPSFSAGFGRGGTPDTEACDDEPREYLLVPKHTVSRVTFGLSPAAAAALSAKQEREEDLQRERDEKAREQQQQQQQAAVAKQQQQLRHANSHKGKSVLSPSKQALWDSPGVDVRMANYAKVVRQIEAQSQHNLEQFRALRTQLLHPVSPLPKHHVTAKKHGHEFFPRYGVDSDRTTTLDGSSPQQQEQQQMQSSPSPARGKLLPALDRDNDDHPDDANRSLFASSSSPQGSSSALPVQKPGQQQQQMPASSSSSSSSHRREVSIRADPSRRGYALQLSHLHLPPSHALSPGSLTARELRTVQERLQSGNIISSPSRVRLAPLVAAPPLPTNTLLQPRMKL